MTYPSERPLPHPTFDSWPFWQAANNGQLIFQSCAECGKVRHYPRPACDRCYSMRVRWIEATGRGRVHTWTVCHHAFLPAFKHAIPYILVTVDMSEGVRMNSVLRAAAGVVPKVGMPVDVAFERISDDFHLPVFVESMRATRDQHRDQADDIAS
jgi:uncharacterized OB-fold protein